MNGCSGLRTAYVWCWYILIAGAEAYKKNVVLAIFDDLRPMLRCYGDDTSFTPNIDRLAADAVLFQNAYAQQALCAPSRNSFLTSRRPDTLHLYDFYSYWRTFAGNFTTMPQYFKEHGYLTKSIGKVFHPGISSNFSDDQPYSWSEQPFHPSTEGYKNAAVCYSDDDPFVPRKNVVCPVREGSQPGGSLPDVESTSEAVQFLKRVPSLGRPFFLALGFHKPHLPLKYPQRYNHYHALRNIKLPKHRTKPPKLPDVAWNPWTDLRERDDIQKLNLSFPYGQIPDHTAKMIRRSYYASITYVDSLFGEVIDQLKITGLYNDTIIVILGDHGWSLGEHGLWSKYSNFEVATRVPLIVKGPSSKTNLAVPRVKNEIVELVDLFPTLAHLADLPDVPTCVGRHPETRLCSQGKNLFDKREVQEAFSQYPRPSLRPQWNSDKPKLKDIQVMGYSIRTRRYRYTEWVKFHGLSPNWSQTVAEELYDHDKDDDEFFNVAGVEEYAEARKHLRLRLRNQGQPTSS